MSDQDNWATPGHDGPPPPGAPAGAPPPAPPSDVPAGGPPPPPPGGAPSPGGAPPPPPPPAGAPPPPTAGDQWGAPSQPPGWGAPGQAWGTPAASKPRVGLVPLFPMGLGDILDTTFRILRAAALPSTLIVLLLLGPLQVLSSAGFQSPFSMLSDPVPEFIDPRLLMISGVASVLTLIAMPLAVAALTWLGAHTTAESAPTWRQALAAGARRYWPTLGAFVLIVLMVIGVFSVVGLIIAGLVVLGDPVIGIVVGVPIGGVALILAIGLYILGYLTVPCIVVEGRGPAAGIGRAWRLLRARFWPTLGVCIVVGLVVSILGSAVSSVISIPGLLGAPAAWAFVALGGVISSLISTPLGAFAALAIHVDQRIRTEGYDIAVLVSELQR